jgi:hypothetical protein
LKAINAPPTGPGSLHEPPTDEKVQPSFATGDALISLLTTCPLSADAVATGPASTPATTAPANTRPLIPRFHCTLLSNVLTDAKLPHLAAKPIVPQYPQNRRAELPANSPPLRPVSRNETLGGMTPASTTADSRYELYQRMEQLSQRFGTAHWFEQFSIDDYADTTWSQWCIAQDGEIRMRCVSSDDVYVYRCEEHDPMDSLAELDAWMEANDDGHEPRPAQEEHDRAAAYAAMLDERNGDDRLRPENQEPDPEELDGRFPAADSAQDLLFGAHAAAQRLSINLETLSPHTTVEGTGVLAVPRSLRHLLRRGVLPI